MAARAWRLGAAVGAVLLVGGCATKGFVREEVQKSEAKAGAEVTRLEQDLGQEKTRVAAVESQVTEVRGTAESASRRAEEAGGQALQAATRAEAADQKAAAAGERAGQAQAKADEAAGTAGQALAKAEQTDARLTKLWGQRHLRALGETVVVTFRFDRWDLDDRAQTALLDVVRQLEQNPAVIVDLEGYTDNQGPSPYNLQLSQRRADAVRRFLVEKGVALHRVQSLGLGDIRPVADNGSRQGREQNRRVALKLFAPVD